MMTRANQNNLLVVGETSESQLAEWVRLYQITHLLSNRFDTCQSAQKAGINVTLADFNLSLLDTHGFDSILFPVSKEKMVSNHVLNQCAKHLTPSGHLFLFGKKNQGIKGYYDNCRKKLGYSGQIVKNKDNYTAKLAPPKDEHPNLRDDDYPQLKQTFSLWGYDVFSKPGIFGWNKIDAGSELLVETLTNHIKQNDADIEEALDLGCGYGYLSLALAHMGAKRITATDTNITALNACKKNLEQTQVEFSVEASDAGMQLTKAHDLIICNPPFHQGYDVANHLTERFLAQSHRLLKENGHAYYVVNAFIPLEKKAQSFFSNVQCLANSGSFKVIQLSK
ncbi:class I SAM-dependent methyltransferase [Teredinibacter sp. KSP-S5-2]|uniref:class I SAM-dependent methyltransferase n=1 Tax=Teredinibacter sp. KSP-S5-2 TaxID=3034506 RepID=UPI0029346CC1|nr:methyltransferase [Teredinibacter sp. KSP-S5-2]WNO11056.1 methyltransferase [Teredinibacter sp. KSP-S5-2]